MSDDRDARTTRLILVPGTWGRGILSKPIDPEVIVSEEGKSSGDPSEDHKRQQGLRWFDPGSEFRESLARCLRELGIDFSTRILFWDGLNSIESRNTAAIALADLIRKLMEQAPDHPIVVIAHSHGGNVALRAAHIADTKGMSKLKVVTLATPFVQICTHTVFEEGNTDCSSPLTDDALSFLRISLTATLSFPFALGLIILAATYDNAISALFQPSIFYYPLVAAIVAAAAVVFFVLSRLGRRLLKLVINPYPVYPGDWGRDDGDPDGWAYKPDRLANFSFYAPRQTTEDWLLVLRGIDDEASLILTAGSIGNRITRFILSILVPYAFQTLALIAVLIFAATSVTGWEMKSLTAMVLLGYALVAFIAGIVVALPGLFRSVYGRELFLGSWRCEIEANSSPDSVKGVQIKTLLEQPELTKRRFRHALYMNPEVPQCIGEWLRT